MGTQTGLQLEILPQPPECWYFRCVPPCPTVAVHPGGEDLLTGLHEGLGIGGRLGLMVW
jgi:hypothetical protein